MDVGSLFLSDLVHYRTYAETLPDGTKETYEQMVNRNLSMHVKKYPQLEAEIRRVYQSVHKKHTLPSMRSFQFAGSAIERANVRMFNCSYTTITAFRDFAEIFYILMCGSGVGYSVRGRHVEQLPEITKGELGKTFFIQDSKEGWADSLKALFENPRINFEYIFVRPAGTPLSTGGTASGPEALQLTHEAIRKILIKAKGRKLSSLEVHDIVCYIADGVVVGGVRRAALISLFDWFDEEMLTCKSGEWWKENPQRARANISASINRNDPKAEEAFQRVMQVCDASMAGEPGVFWTNHDDWGTNPCAEIALQPKSFCNLTEVNLAGCKTLQDLYDAVEAASAIGTLQATYTDFEYLTPQWKDNVESERLLGVSLTGIAEYWPNLSGDILRNLAQHATRVNREWAMRLGINYAARVTCVKPSGTASAFLGTTSGIHSAHSKYYLRRVRIDKSHPIAAHLKSIDAFTLFIEEDKSQNNNYVITIPVCKKNSVTRDEGAMGLIKRAHVVSNNWIDYGHLYGENKHNVSMTVSYKPEEWSAIHSWMWLNRPFYTGISLLPYDGGTYEQMPFEEIDEEKYSELSRIFMFIDLSKVSFKDVRDERVGEAACAGGSCEFK